MLPFLLPSSESEYVTGHYWLDVKTTKNNDGGTILDVSFWPIALPEDQQPTALVSLHNRPGDHSNVILGCKDGYLRRFQNNFVTDDGVSITSYVDYGPFPLGDAIHDGIVAEIQGVTVERSGDVTWEIRVGRSAQDAVNETESASSGTWDLEGLSYRSYPRARGQAFVVRIEGAEDLLWGLESVSVVLAPGGTLRR